MSPLLLGLLLSGCIRCGSYTFTSNDGVLDGAFEECGPMSGTFAEVDGSNLLLSFVPTTNQSDVDEALVAAAPELLLTLPDSSLLPHTTYGVDQLHGTASAWVEADDARQVASLTGGQLEVVQALAPSLLGEDRWAMVWSLTFESEALTVVAEGSDKVDIVVDATTAGF